MELTFEAAFQTMVAKELMTQQAPDCWKLAAGRVPENILSIALERNSEEQMLMDFLSLLAELELDGAKGLKARTGLLEYRYDVA